MSRYRRGNLGLIHSAGVENPEPPPAPQSEYKYIQDAFRPVWGRRSHWIEPWRSYLDTTPAIDVLNGLGINLNSKQKQIPYVCELLARMGFRRVRIEPGWNSLSYSDPSKFTTTGESAFKTQVESLKNNGLRPLILLNANHGDPCPSTAVTLKATEAAPVGATTLKVETAGLASIVKGRTGISQSGIKSNILFKDYSEDGTVQLSQPLKAEVKVGTIPQVFTLKYEPFRSVADTTGATPNAAFEETMLGWLNYAKVVTNRCKELLGSEEFDVEVWNELGFGSNFLGINNYYSPAIETTSSNTLPAIWGRTLAFLRDPANGVPNIGVNNGFVNQSNGIMAGPGATANSRHPYPGRQVYPTFDTKEDSTGNVFESGALPEDANGKVANTKNAKGFLVPIFVPEYVAWFPEAPFCYLQTECKVLDTAPYTSYIPNNSKGDTHGRTAPAAKEPSPKDEHGGLQASCYSKQVAGQAPVRLWVTETNIGSWANGVPNVTAADKRHLETKVILRSLIIYLTKGVQALYFYAAGDGAANDLSLIDKTFFEDVAARPEYPGDAAGGETMLAVGRLTGTLAGATQISKQGTVSLADLTDYAGNVQFKGTTAFPEYSFPDKTNKDCFFFAPMQVNDSRKFVCSVYVMTKNVAHEYGGTGVTRFDLPEEKYRMKIEGVKGSNAVVSALDPVTGTSIPVTTVESGANQLVAEMKVTDYPRLLTIQET